MVGFDKAEQLFLSLGVPECILLTPDEAEVAKLLTNMYRYINFAFSNQMYLQTLSLGIDINKVITAANKDYPRMNMPLPGLAAGYCLSKDGMSLLQDGTIGAEMIQVSKSINESLPNHIAHMIAFGYGDEYTPYPPGNVLILGAGFKKNSDDTRLSLTYKLKKALTLRGISHTIYDPLVPEHSTVPEFEDFDCVVVMTPHDIFDEELFSKFNIYTLVIDIWKHFQASKKQPTGIYKI
jgi:UDP-N-acetyl-D-mannosaminuronic acid dehydrogenase